MAEVTVDIILRAVFGVSEGPGLDEGRRILAELLAVFSPAILFTKATHSALFPPWRRWSAGKARFQAWAEARIAEARTREGGEDVLSMMVAARYDDGSAMTDEEIGTQMATLLFAGHETTAIALSWAVHWLHRNPATLARLREEIASLGPSPEAEAIAKLPYLGAVCDETLRLHPIVTENLRQLKKPLRVGEHEIPAGVGVGVAIAAIHEDPALYPEPQAFKPERFLERRYTAFEHLPFGGGHRRCIGAAFAEHEMRIVLATLVSGWDLELLRPDEKPVRRSITLGPEHGVPVRVIGAR
jgi:cytochrome P450